MTLVLAGISALFWGGWVPSKIEVKLGLQVYVDIYV